MDELKQAWGNISLEQPRPELLATELQEIISRQSSGVIEKLRKNVKVKLYYAIFFTLAFSIGLPFVFPVVSQVLMMIMIAAYLVGSILLYQELKMLNTGIDMSQDLLQALTSYSDRIKTVLKYEENVALCLYPVSVTAGFLFGMQLYDRESPIMTQSAHWAILIITLIVFTLGGNWLAKWMNQKAFGKYLDELDANIAELKKEA